LATLNISYAAVFLTTLQRKQKNLFAKNNADEREVLRKWIELELAYHI